MKYAVQSEENLNLNLSKHLIRRLLLNTSNINYKSQITSGVMTIYMSL